MKNSNGLTCMTGHDDNDQGEGGDGHDSETKEVEPSVTPITNNSESSSSNDIEAPSNYNSSHKRADPDQSSFAKYNDLMLQNAMKEVGVWSYGTVMTELWVFDSGNTSLYPRLSRQASWVDPMYKRTYCSCRSRQRSVEEESPCCPVCAITEPSHPQYITPDPVSIGEGLAGTLWASATTQQAAGSTTGRRDSLTLSRHSVTSLGTTTSALTLGTTTLPLQQFFFPSTATAANVTWRHLRSLARDPDQAWNPRLVATAELPGGIDWVTGIPYTFPSQHRGVLVVLARAGDHLSRLCSAVNQDFLYMSAQHIGSLHSLRQPWLQAVELNQETVSEQEHTGLASVTELDDTMLDQVMMVGEDDSTEVQILKSPPTLGGHGCWTSLGQDIVKRVLTVASKARGAGMTPPPPMSTRETFVTFAGVFWTLLLLTLLNEVVKKRLGDDFEIVLGPFGAFLTLLYGLTSAPATQPRNAILGQTVSLTIAVSIGKYCTFLSVWMKQSLGTAIAVATMTRLGITHPPAGAAALIILGSDKYGWGNLLFLLIGTSLAILSATFINNWSDKRQYPSYWGIRPKRRDKS